MQPFSKAGGRSGPHPSDLGGCVFVGDECACWPTIQRSLFGPRVTGRRGLHFSCLPCARVCVCARRRGARVYSSIGHPPGLGWDQSAHQLVEFSWSNTVFCSLRHAAGGTWAAVSGDVNDQAAHLERRDWTEEASPIRWDGIHLWPFRQRACCSSSNGKYYKLDEAAGEIAKRRRSQLTPDLSDSQLR